MAHKTVDDSFFSHQSRPPQTKIVCSLRPNTDFLTIKHLLLSGMNVVRIASVFGTQKELEILINRIRDASSITKRLCGIILETHGTSAMVGPVLMRATPKQSPAFPPTHVFTTNGSIEMDEQKENEQQSSLSKPLSPLTLQPINHSNNKPKISNDLQSLSTTLNLAIENLPQSIIDNAAFAVNNIVKQKKEITNETKNDNDEHNEEDEDETKDNKNDNGDSFHLPLMPRRGSDCSMHPNDHHPRHHLPSLTQQDSNLSYDGNSMIIKPDISLTKGSMVRIVTDRIIEGSSKKFSICFPGLTSKLKIGKFILISPSIKLEIISISHKLSMLTCRVITGGPLKEYSNVEFPSLKIEFPSITQQDVSDIYFAVINDIDYICVSNVKSLADIITTKEMIELHYANIDNMRKMARNTSYNIDTDNGGNPQQQQQQQQQNGNNIRVLAKIENAQCLNDINDIITESDGIIIDHISLLHSYKKTNESNLNEDEDDKKIKEKIKEIISDIIRETRIQAKPYSICCEIETNLLDSAFSNNNDYTLIDIEHDLKLLHDLPSIPININSFLSYDDVECIEFCVSFECDSICLLTDINRFKKIYNETNSGSNSSMSSISTADTSLSSMSSRYQWKMRKDVLYIHAIIKSLCAVITKKEISLIEFYQNDYGKYSTLSIRSGGSTANNNTITMEHDNNNHHNNNHGIVHLNDNQSDSGNETDESEDIRKIYEVESIFDSMASSSVKTAYDLNCALIIVLTQSGRIARCVSKYRPHCIILAITDNEIIARQCMFISSIFPILVLNMNGTDSLISRALHVAYRHKLIKKKNDKVVVLAGTQSDILDEPCDFIMKLLYVDL